MNALMQYNPTPIEGQGPAIARALELKQAMQRNALMEMQMQAAQQEQAQRAQQNALMQQFRQSIPSPQMAASQTALMDGGGPTVANAQRMQPVDPRMQVLHGAMQAGMVSPMDYVKEAYPKDEFVSVAPGTVRLNARTNQPVFTAPNKPESSPELVRLMDAMNAMPEGDPRRSILQAAITKATTHAPGVSVSYGAPQAGQDAQGNPVFFQPSKDGKTPPAIVPGVRPPAKAENLTEGQARALQFASRMEAADRAMQELAGKGVTKSLPGSMQNNLVGDALTMVSTPEGQQLNQAKRDFVNAVLRRESGAVISAEEFANANRQYFPQIGDSKQVMQQKADNRRRAIEGMRADVPSNRQSEVDRIAAPKAAQGEPKKIASDADYNALPSGATFIAPDGTTRRKP